MKEEDALSHSIRARFPNLSQVQRNSIQIGLSRHIIREYVDDWVSDIEDVTPCVRKIHDLLQSGRGDQAKRLLPPERVYPVHAELGRPLLISGSKDKAARRGT